MTNRLPPLIVPFLIFLVSIYGSLHMGDLPPLWVALLPTLPFILAIITVLLAWHFNKGRVFILALLLLIPKVYEASCDGAVAAYLVVSCFCIALLGCVKERGFMNRFVLNRLLFVLMLLCWCYAVESRWVSFAFLSHPFLFFSFSWSDVLFWGALFISVAGVGGIWWTKNSAFCASALVSLFCLVVMNRFSLLDSQEDVLLSSQYLLWVLFLLMESRRMAYLDEMTGLPGRRALNEALLGVSKAYVLVMVDVDHFKKFNDSYGHDMGDKVLKSVAQQLNRYTSLGRAFRYGGEEFTLLLRGKGLNEVETLLEELRQQIALLDIDVIDSHKKESVVNVTASFGVAFSTQNELPEQVMKRADEALYQAKRKGRNRVVKAE